MFAFTQQKGHPACKKLSGSKGWAGSMVIRLERDADLHMAQLMPLPLTVSCFSKINIGFTFLVLDHPGSPGKGQLNARVCVCIIYFNSKINRKGIRVVFEFESV